MKIIDILHKAEHPFPSIEIVPPLKGITRDELISTVGKLMEFSPKYINVTSHRDEYSFTKEADGSFSRHLVRNRVSPVAVCCAIKEAFDVSVVPHIICGGHTAEEIESQLYDLRFLNIENIMALRGDSISGEKRFAPEQGGYAHADSLVSAAKRFGEENGFPFCIGVGAYPEKHFEAANLETDIQNLKRKVDAGADYIITQMFFDNSVFYSFIDKCRAAGITVPIIPGLKPISSAKQIRLLPEAFSLDIPVELTSEIEKSNGANAYEIGTEWCTEQCRDLIAHGVPAVHFYTMGKADNISQILRKCF